MADSIEKHEKEGDSSSGQCPSGSTEVDARETQGLAATSGDAGVSADKEAPSNSRDVAAAEPEAEEYPHGFMLVMVLIALFMNTFLAALDLGIVATAIPQITDEFRELDQVGWYGSAYFLTVGIFSPFWGKLYKYCQTKVVFLCTIAIFEVGSIVCATSPNSSALIVGRAIQGWGAAGILGGGFLIVHHVVAPRRRPAFTGLLLAVFLCSSILGPIIGGAFTTGVTWRWCFYINLPVGGLAVALILIFFHTPKHVKPVPATLREIFLHLDPLGIVVIIASLVCYILALQWGGQTKPWSDGSVIATLVLWVFLTIVFVVVEYFVGEYAMVPPRLLKRRITWSNSLFGFILNDPDWTFLYYLPIYFQSVQNLSAIDSGVANLTFLVMFSVGSLVGGNAVGRLRLVQPIATVGGLICTAGAALCYTLDESSTRSRYMGYQVLLGLGIGIGNQLPMTAVQGFSAPEDLASNTGVVLFAQMISGCYFVTAAQSIFSNVLVQALPRYAPNVDPLQVLHTGATEIWDVFSGDELDGVLHAYTQGVKGAFALGLAGAAFSVLVSFTIPTKKLPSPEKESTPEGEAA
ncbi:putative MFS transporter [Hypoxylon sp. FL1857]|nr:putative MFS transporter [Hypoxylon sp. FL1857]